jgi:hypothetical protein
MRVTAASHTLLRGAAVGRVLYEAVGQAVIAGNRRKLRKCTPARFFDWARIPRMVLTIPAFPTLAIPANSKIQNREVLRPRNLLRTPE